jgi:hypothetical protein
MQILLLIIQKICEIFSPLKYIITKFCSYEAYSSNANVSVMLFCPQQNGSFRPRASFVVGRNPYKKTEKMDAIYRHKAESSCKKFYKSGKGKHRKFSRKAEVQ